MTPQPQELIKYVADRTGAQLVVTKEPGATALFGRTASVGVPNKGTQRVETVARLGEFEIGIFYDWTPELEQFLVEDLEPDENNVYWERQYPLNEARGPYWSAMKIYGNLQVVWWSETRELDERWRRLDSLIKAFRREQ